MTTAQQQQAIQKQAAFYETDECPCAGLISHRVYDPRERTFGFPDGAVAVDFTYRYEDDSPGLETTVFAADGTVITSQDYG